MVQVFKRNYLELVTGQETKITQQTQHTDLMIYSIVSLSD